MTAELLEAAHAYNEAPKRLREAIIKAAQQGETATDITKMINFTYSMDYVAKIVREALGPRPRGRRKTTPDSSGSPASE
ncbi:helix-turn-helix domain containing protein [Streptosporangium sp. NBC_01755]|uniref:hypothetical protein n=1 Tax=Streptosporangium sp. NBC_01755 TaxID=2975949 RepID=UPI002DD97245|nr:hypothetical protein [Streptosporangium sp. NBC_01755]WSD01490.1 helix-turn-helix domain containing protein [Streptosporangium sp. NBC_01755]